MSSPITLTWSFQTLTGVADPTGVVTFQLQNYGSSVPMANGSVLSPLNFSVTASAGNGTTSIWTNADISPANTYYTLKFFSSSGSYIGDAAYVISGTDGSTVNLNTLTPLYVFPSPATITYGATGPAGPAGPTGATGTTGATGAPGSSTNPWFDIQNYSGLPKTAAIAAESTSATVSGTAVTLGAAKNFANGEGIVIYKAGAATSLSSGPTAPTVTCPAIAGSGPSAGQQTITYKIVAFDSKQGLSPASSAATLTTAPSVFGPPQVNISSISQSSGTVTVNFSSPLNNSVVAGMALHITGMGLIPGNLIPGDQIFNGVWQIATAPSTSQVTFALSGNYGSGTVSAGTTLGRVSNVAIITAISRAATGIVTVTTAQPHNFEVQTGTFALTNQTLVTIDNVTPNSMQGTFVLASTPTANTFTYSTGILSSQSGSINTAGSTGLATTTATVWEFITVLCPQPSGSTVGYYIYSDSPSPGGSLALVGKSFPGQADWTDWGPFYGSGFTAPSYVPATPPASAQNQLYVGSIVSGAGSTSLVITPSVSNNISGSTIVHDDSQAIVNACAARSQGGVSLTANNTSGDVYIINYPITVPNQRDLLISAGLVANETINFGGYSHLSCPLGTITSSTPQFGNRNYTSITGVASPILSSVSALTAEGISISLSGNGKVGVSLQNFYATFEKSSFLSNSGGTNVGVVFSDCGAGSLFRDCNFQGSSILGNQNVVGQPAVGPPVGVIWYRASTASGLGNAQVRMEGANTFNGRGILVDQKYRLTGATYDFYFGDGIWNQATSTPMIMFWGQLFSNITVCGVLNDSSQQPALANWTTQGFGPVTLINCANAGTWPIVTGNPVTGGFSTLGCTNVYQVSQLQAFAGSFTTGSGTTDTVTIYGATSSSHVMLFPANAAAATMVYTSPGIYVSSVTSNSVVFTHGGSLSGATFNFLVTPS